VNLVNQWYVRSFQEILEFEKTDVSDSVLDRYVHSQTDCIVMYVFLAEQKLPTRIFFGNIQHRY
jgi:hypothetical protein